MCADRLCVKSSPGTASVQDQGEGRLLCGMYFIVELKGSSEISVLAVVFLPSPLSGCLVRFLEHCGGIQTLLSSFLMIWDLMRRTGLAALDLNLAFNE